MSFEFKFEGNSVKCIVEKEYLHIDKEGNKRESIEIADIIAAVEAKENADKESTKIYVFKIQKLENFKMASLQLTFTGDQATCQKFKETVQSNVNKQERPKLLLVLISPTAGAQKGEQIYRKIICPLFELAGITTEIMISEYPDHIKDFMESYDIHKVDGFVVFGGDGSFNQCFGPLLEKTQRDAGIDYNSPTSTLTPTLKPIGLVPTGTGAATANISYGCIDPVTAALHIIKGCKRQFGATAVYSDNKCIGFSNFLFGFGLMADMFHYTEGFRWLRAHRYLPVAFYYHLFKTIPNFYADITLYLRPKSSDTDEREACSSDVTVVEKGRYFDVLFSTVDLFRAEFNMDSKTLMNNNSCLLLYNNNYSSRFQLLKNFIRIMTRRNLVNPHYLKSYEVSGYKLKLDTTSEPDTAHTYRLMFDGEYKEIKHPEWEVRIRYKSHFLFSQFFISEVEQLMKKWISKILLNKSAFFGFEI